LPATPSFAWLLYLTKTDNTTVHVYYWYNARSNNRPIVGSKFVFIVHADECSVYNGTFSPDAV